MRIDAHLAVLDLKAWGPDALSVAVLHDAGTAALFDAGLPGSLPDLREKLAAEGIPFEAVDRVLVTHHDFDHIGMLPELLAAAAPGRIRILSHVEDKPYVEGTLPPYKADPAVRARIAAGLPPGMELGPARPLPERPLLPVAATFVDGQYLDYAGGVTAVHIPGHVPGHCCYYLHAARVLVAGDALHATAGVLEPPSPVHTADYALALASLRKLAAYDIDTVVCYHGGLVRGDLKRRIQEVADGAKEA